MKILWKKEHLLFLIPIAAIIVIAYILIDIKNGFSLFPNYGSIGDFFNGFTTPIITIFMAIYAYRAFLSQKEQLELQKKETKRLSEESKFQQIEGTFFQLFGLFNNMVNGLEYETTVRNIKHTGKSYFEKVYVDLMNFYIEEDGEVDERIKTAMEKLDNKHNSNFHLYFKNIFQLFNWIYEHRNVLNENRIKIYVDLIRAQLSRDEMILLYFNTTYLGRNYFSTILKELHFKYNTDNYGSVEMVFVADVEKYETGKEQLSTPLKNKGKIVLNRDELMKTIENEEIEIYYQPIVSATDNKMIMAEALMRLEHTKGTIPPEDLIKQMEYHTFTNELLDYLLGYVCHHIKQTKSKLAYSVNLSINQLLLSDVAEQIEAICKKHHVTNEQIQFEITESDQLFRHKEIRNIIQSLQVKGYRVGIDNFGNGYFAFHDLMDLPIDFIKVDKQFVKKLDQDASIEPVVTHILEIARHKDWFITIEGIETDEQLKMWQNLNVDAFQGYFFGEPVPEKEEELSSTIQH